MVHFVCLERKPSLTLLPTQLKTTTGGGSANPETQNSRTKMVFSSLVVVSVAHVSADLWQHVACLPERLSSRQLLDLVCVIPLQELGRLTLCLWTFLCLPPPDSYYSRYSDSDSDSDTTVDYDDYYYDPHSD